MLNDKFTPEQLNTITVGIRKFIRLQGLIHDPDPRVWGEWLADEGDLYAALNSIRLAFKATEPMLGKRKYQGVDFDAPGSVKSDMITFLTCGEDGNKSSSLSRRNLPMYYLILDPVIELFAAFDHPTILEIVDQVIDEIVMMVESCDEYGTYDDALVAQHQVRELIRAKEAARRAALDLKPRRKPRRDPLIDMIVNDETAEVDSTLDEGIECEFM